MSSANPEKQWLVGITDYIEPPADIEQEGFPEADLVFLQDPASSNAARQQWQQADALLTWHWPIRGETIDLLDNCKIVVRYGVGFDTVDVPGLAERSIPLCNTPDYGTEEVADAACAMILAIQRKTVLYDRLARGYGETWQEHTIKPQLRTSHATLGLVGVGRIGTAVVNRMKPFGFKILGYDPYQPSGHEKAVGYTRVRTLDELLSQSDIVSMHCPLTNETRGMVDAAFFAAMKPGSAFVNTARGGVTDGLSSLEDALRSGHLAMAGLDVLPSEPPKPHPLLDAWRADEDWLKGRLIINPHAAWHSDQGWYEMRYKAAETARMFLLEGYLRNLIQPTTA